MLKPNLKVWFMYWSRDVSRQDNFFLHALSKRFEVEIAYPADVIFFMCFDPPKHRGLSAIIRKKLRGTRGVRFETPDMSWLSGNPKLVFYTQENVRPNLDRCHLALGFDFEDEINDERYMRLPFYVTLLWGKESNLLSENRKINIKNSQERKFCEYLYSHTLPERKAFFESLSSYHHIDAPGKSCNNMPPIGNYDNSSDSRNAGDWVDQRLEFAKNYRFSIAFENTTYPGYTTEKIFTAFLAGCIPIYWGHSRISEEFNSAAFFNANDFDSLEDLSKAVYQVESDFACYETMLREPPYLSDRIPEVFSEERFLNRLEDIL